MITVSIYRSALDKDIRETQRIENPITIKELFPGVDLTNSIISVNGFWQDENYLLQDGDICTIRLFPRGDAGTVIGGIIGFTVGVALSLIPGVGIPLAMAFIFGGVYGGALAGSGLIQRLLNPNAAGNIKSPETLEQIPQLRGAKNQSAYGQPVPLVLGKHLFTPGYVGRPYTQISGEDGEDQYFYALYLLGYGKLKVTDIKLGVIGELASNAADEDNGYLTFDGDPFLADGNPQLELIQSGDESDIYPQAVVEEQLNIELSNVDEPDAVPLNVTRFTARNPMKIQIEISLPGGLVKYNDEGKKTNASVELSARWRISRPDNSDTWKEFGQFGIRNPQQEGISYALTSNSIESNPTTTITRAKNKVMRFIAEKTFTDYSEVSDTADTRVLELEIIRVNKQSTSSQVIDKVYLTAVRTWLFDNKESKGGSLVAQVPVIDKLRNKTARLGFSIKATQNTQGMLDALNCILESKCRTWDSGTKTWSDPDWDIANQQWVPNPTETPSNNPAALALKLLQSPTLGRKAYPDSMLDMDSFGEFYEWCDEDIVDPRTGKTTKRASCNGVLTQAKRTDEVLSLILATGRAMRILNGNKYGLLIDKPRDYPVMILNSQNVLEASNQKAFADLPDGFLIKFINEADGYQQTDIYVTADGTNEPSAESVIENLELPYITNREQAIRMGWYQLACRRLRPEIWNRKLSVDGYLIGIGDLVEVQDDTIVVGIGEGAAVTGVITDTSGLITEIQTDGQFDVTDMTKQYGIKIMQADGISDIVVRTLQVYIPEPGIYSDFTFTSPVSLPTIPPVGSIVAFGEYEKITTPALCFGKKDNGDGTFDVTLVPYQEGIYETDSGEIPPYEANITSPQAPVQVETVPDYVENINDRIDGAYDEASNKIFSDFRFAKSSGITTLPPISTDTDDPGSNWTDTPPSITDNEYLWMTKSQWKGTIRTSYWSVPVRMSGPVGTSGQNAVYLNLDNENHSIACDIDGNPKPGSLGFTIQATLYDGTNAVNPADVVFDIITTATGITIGTSGVILVDSLPLTDNNGNEFDISGDSLLASTGDTVLNDVTLVTVEALYKGTPYYATLTLVKVKDGSAGLDGAPAVTYRLIPLVSVVKKDKDGNLSPSSPITCVQYKYEAGQETVSTERMEYQLSTQTSSAVYPSSGVSIGNASWLEFTLYSGANMVLDRQRVPVVQDGQTGSYYEPRYQRSLSQPAAPTGNNPAAWSTTPPSGTNPLWMTRGLKSANDSLQGTWSTPVKIDGTGIVSISYKFRVTSTSTAPAQAWTDSSWLTSMPAISVTNKYLWYIERIAYTDGTNKDTIGLQAVYGDTGSTGATGNYYQTQYQRAASRPATPVGDNPSGWTTDPSSYSGTNPLWMIRGVKNAAGVLQGVWSVPVQISGEDGKDGLTLYTWIKYADNAQGAGISDSPTGKTYIGFAYNKTTAAESNTPTDYTWSLIKGSDGIPGTPGTDGKTFYTWIKYADNAQGGGLSDSPTGKAYIGFAYNKTTATESSVPGDYSWSLIKGADGVPGTPGTNGKTLYTWVKYSDNSDGTGLYDIPTAATKYIGIAVNKETQTESTNKADYTWSLFKGTDGVPGTPGANGVTLYTWIKYADAADGTGLYDVPTSATKYIGIAVNKETQTESTDKTDYVWSLFKGADGVPGKDGLGIDSLPETSYAHWSADELPSLTTSSLTDNNGNEFDISGDILLASVEVEIIGSPLIDNSGNGRHLALSGGVFSTIGRFDKGLRFAGTLINTANLLNDLYGRPSSLSVWINITSWDNNGYAVIMGGGISNRGYIRLSAAGISVLWNYSSGSSDILEFGRLSVLGVWYHIAVTFDYNAVKVYVNGELAAQKTISSPPFNYLYANIGGFTGLMDEIALFDRVLSYNEVYTLSKTALPKKYDPAISHTPRYLGKTLTAPSTSNVVIQVTATITQTVMAHEGDWIAYVGPDDGGWLKGYLYEWNGTQWLKLDPLKSDDSAQYMSALADLTDGAPDGIFSALLVRNLIAQQAAIEELQTKIIKLINPNDTTKYIELNGQSGRIRSNNFVNTLTQRTGFDLESADGSAEFDKLDSWSMKTRVGITEDPLNSPATFPSGLFTVPQRGGIRAMAQFWDDPADGGIGYNGVSMEYGDSGSLNDYNRVVDITKVTSPANGVYKLTYQCKDQNEVTIMEWARIFGYYTTGGTAIDDGTYIPGNWGIIIQDSPGRSVTTDGLEVTYTFVCQFPTQTIANPSWFGTLLLIA